jgi:hypothetical protein
MLLEVITAAAEPTRNSDTTQVIIAALSAAGVGAIIASIITGLFSKKKLGAEAAEIITKAASGVVERMEVELARERDRRVTERAEHTERVERMEAEHCSERMEWRRVLQLHVAWDAIAIGEMAKLGIELPPAPPLTPPVQSPLS